MNIHITDTFILKITVKMKNKIGRIAKKYMNGESGRTKTKTKMTSMIKTLDYDDINIYY